MKNDPISLLPSQIGTTEEDYLVNLFKDDNVDNEVPISEEMFEDKSLYAVYKCTPKNDGVYELVLSHFTEIGLEQTILYTPKTDQDVAQLNEIIAVLSTADNDSEIYCEIVFDEYNPSVIEEWTKVMKHINIHKQNL